MSTHGLEHEREHPVVDRDGNPVVGDDPTLLPRDPDGTEADADAEAEYRASDPHTPGGGLRTENVAEPIVLPATPDAPSHRKDTPIDAPLDDADDGTTPAAGVQRDEPVDVPGAQTVPPVTDDVPVGEPAGDVSDRDRADRDPLDRDPLDRDAPDASGADPLGAGAAGADTPGRVTDNDWLELQGRFVDDPQAAVREASDLLDRAIAEIRRDLRASESTEDLRTAFRRYRDTYRSLR